MPDSIAKSPNKAIVKDATELMGHRPGPSKATAKRKAMGSWKRPQFFTPGRMIHLLLYPVAGWESDQLL